MAGFAPGLALGVAPGAPDRDGEAEEEEEEELRDDELRDEDDDDGRDGDAEGIEGLDGDEVGVGIGGVVLELELVVAQPAIHEALSNKTVKRNAIFISDLLRALGLGFWGSLGI